jgi:hypothetical protein
MISFLKAIYTFMVCNFVFHTNYGEVGNMSTVRFSYLLLPAPSQALRLLYLEIYSNYLYQVTTLQTS